VNTEFVPSQVNVAAGAQVTITFDNQDPAVLHDLVVFDSGGSRVAETEVFEGPASRVVTFTPAAGTYPFTCTVHPQQMRGTLRAQ
jgi:plastocyanin